MATATQTKSYVTNSIDVEKIVVRNRKRHLDDAKVAELAHSINEIGLINPVTVRAVNSHYELVAGYHRLEAFKLLRIGKIPTYQIEFNGDELAVELAEIDENLRRNDLTKLEQGEHLERRNQILAEMGIRAQRGAQSGNQNASKNEGETDFTPVSMFDAPPQQDPQEQPKTTAEIAAEAGLSERSAQQRMQIANDLLPETKDLIRGHAISDILTQLLELARLKGEDQTQAAALIVSGQAKDVSKAKKIIKDQKKEEQRAEAAKQAENVPQNELAKVVTGDFRKLMEELPDNSIDMIFTDPPYDEKSVKMYEEMAELAARKLKPNGSLLAYVGHYAIIDIGALMKKHLRFWWTIALEHGGSSARLQGKWVFVGWKPILWFVKGGRGKDNEYVSDIFKSKQPTKKEHDWQQDTSEAEYYIDKLCPPGGVVLDPFCGSGTTLLAALKLDRRSIGIEIDEERAAIARGRIHDNA